MEPLIVVAEFRRGLELEGCRQYIPLLNTRLPLSIGRSSKSGVVVGLCLSKEDGFAGASATHATIDRFDDGSIVLRDGNGRASTHGIWLDGERVNRVILYSVEGVLFRETVCLTRLGLAEVRLWIQTEVVPHDSPKDTASGLDLLGGVQMQGEYLTQQIALMGEQLQGFQQQLALRVALDTQLKEREQAQAGAIERLERGVKRSLSVAILSVAVAIFGSGMFQVLDESKQKSLVDWAETIGIPLLLAGAGWKIQQPQMPVVGAKDGQKP